ncbi:MAG: hypothetical protein PHS57_04180 [Alphaproteobacteria bacterium]|nr:hypothetical protein [Alphaproteobacteria bacterium]
MNTVSLMPSCSHKVVFLFAVLLGSVLLAGCSSIARGVTEAVLEQGTDKKDLRQCEIDGPAFDGLSASLDKQTPQSPETTKVLMVHGISNHVPGYSNRFQKKLYEELGLSVMDSTVKTIQLDSKDFTKENGLTLGTLRVTRHVDPKKTHELIFYELTWSPITSQQKEGLESDSTNNDGLARASLNDSLKNFINTTVPDLLIYNGNGYRDITLSVFQSVCWMLSNTWDDLPGNGRHRCEDWPDSVFSNLAANDHFFVTHSLGSRITIDTIQNFSTDKNPESESPLARKVRDIIRDKDFTVFMMANQLPLLQMGRDRPNATGARRDYCSPQGKFFDRRVMRKMTIVAISDPNDILSYPIPTDFTEKQIDSRICPSVTNVSLNIAEQKDLFDTASFANPLTAHSGYMDDDRVIKLIARGLRRDNLSPLIAKRCRWSETTALKD